jgi:hypothetical protein
MRSKHSRVVELCHHLLLLATTSCRCDLPDVLWSSLPGFTSVVKKLVSFPGAAPNCIAKSSASKAKDTVWFPIDQEYAMQVLLCSNARSTTVQVGRCVGTPAKRRCAKVGYVAQRLVAISLSQKGMHIWHTLKVTTCLDRSTNSSPDPGGLSRPPASLSGYVCVS